MSTLLPFAHRVSATSVATLPSSEVMTFDDTLGALLIGERACMSFCGPTQLFLAGEIIAAVYFENSATARILCDANFYLTDFLA